MPDTFSNQNRRQVYLKFGTALFLFAALSFAWFFSLGITLKIDILRWLAFNRLFFWFIYEVRVVHFLFRFLNLKRPLKN